MPYGVVHIMGLPGGMMMWSHPAVSAPLEMPGKQGRTTGATQVMSGWLTGPGACHGPPRAAPAQREPPPQASGGPPPGHQPSAVLVRFQPSPMSCEHSDENRTHCCSCTCAVAMHDRARCNLEPMRAPWVAGPAQLPHKPAHPVTKRHPSTTVSRARPANKATCGVPLVHCTVSVACISS